MAYYYPNNPINWINEDLINYITQNIQLPLVYSNNEVYIFQYNQSLSLWPDLEWGYNS